MLDEVSAVKKKLMEAISQLCEASWMFTKDPERNFTRKRKLPFDKVISFLLAMEGGSLTTELLNYFECTPDSASSAAFVQQRGKIDASAFHLSCQNLKNKSTQNSLLHLGQSHKEVISM